MATKKSAKKPVKMIEVYERGVKREVPMEGPITPPMVVKIPEVVEPYANSVPVQARDSHTADPITRTDAMTRKVHLVTVFLSILTGCLMAIMGWFPKDWPELFIFALWLVIASGEWLLAFILIAYLDYKETPAAINWFLARNYMGMMHKEQHHRLRAMYPDQFEEEE